MLAVIIDSQVMGFVYFGIKVFYFEISVSYISF